jgi:hypothetical protein
MPKRYHLTGQTFGLLTVTGESAERGRGRRILWDCSCQCGGKATAVSSELVRGTRVSCGCRWRKGVPRKNGQSLSNRQSFRWSRYSSAIDGAKKRGHEWSLTREQWASIVERPCAFCGTKSTIGVDRIDASKPYDSANTMPLCWECNRAKGPLDMGEFREWIDRVAKHSGRGA